MDLTTAILTGLGLAAAAGLNAYIPLFLVGLLGAFGVITLPEPYALLGKPVVVVIVGVLLAIEVLADKIPAVDSLNDVLGTVIRPAAGAVLFAGSTGAVGVPAEVSLVLGLITAGTVHGAKAVARPVLNAGTGGVAAPFVRATEDTFSLGLALSAVFVPFLVLLLLLVLSVWLVRRLLRRRQRAPVVTPAS